MSIKIRDGFRNTEQDSLGYFGALTEDEFLIVHRLTLHVRPGQTQISDYALGGGLFLLAFGLWGVITGGASEKTGAWLLMGTLAMVAWWFARPNPRKMWRDTPALRQPYRGVERGRKTDRWPRQEGEVQNIWPPPKHPHVARRSPRYLSVLVS